ELHRAARRPQRGPDQWRRLCVRSGVARFHSWGAAGLPRTGHFAEAYWARLIRAAVARLLRRHWRARRLYAAAVHPYTTANSSGSTEAFMTFIRAKAPLRISFSGGGTDVPPFPQLEGGCVLSTTINRY